jgi:creatinine amidohydrolase
MNTQKGIDDFRSHRLELMHPQEIIEERERAPIAYIPLGPMEWHGPHLPFGTDMLHAYWIALDTVKETGGVVLPPLPLGTETLIGPIRERHRGFGGTERIFGMDFPGFSIPSLYNEESVFGAIVQDLVQKFKHQKFKVVVIVSGHGGQNHFMTLMRIAREQTVPGDFIVIHAYGLREQSKYHGGHAEKGETAFMLAYYPEAVYLGALPPLPEPLYNIEFGILDNLTCMGKPTEDFTVRTQQDPRTATSEEGQADHDYGVKLLVDLVNKKLKDMTPQEFPWF